MVKYLFFVTFSITALTQLVAQSATPSAGYVSSNNKQLPEGPDNSLFLDREWTLGSILLINNRIIRDCSLRYDIVYGYIETQSETGIRASPEQWVQQFVMKKDDSTRWFISGLLFEYNQAPITGLMEVLVDEPTQLLLHTRFYAFDEPPGVGSISAVKKAKYYLTQENQLIDATTKKKMFEAFGEQQDHMKKWAKTAKIKYNDPKDVIALVMHYNTISTE